jgi:hypothetical protein
MGTDWDWSKQTHTRMGDIMGAVLEEVKVA